MVFAMADRIGRIAAMGAREEQGELGRGVAPDRMRRYRMFIDARWQSGRAERVVPSVNPTTERVRAEFQDAQAEDVDRGVAVADRAFENGPWRRMNATERGRMLRRIADRLASAKEREWLWA
jgi:hypothetical protein